MLKFNAVIYPDLGSDWLIAYNPETGTTTQGKTPGQALANLIEATGLYLEEFSLPPNERLVLKSFTVA